MKYSADSELYKIRCGWSQEVGGLTFSGKFTQLQNPYVGYPEKCFQKGIELVDGFCLMH